MVSEEDSEEEEEDEIISEAAEYSPKSEFSKPKIIYDAMERCLVARAKEMKAGYYNTKLTKEGIPIKQWVEDTRQIFIGSVIAAQTCLNPEIKQEEAFKKRIDKYEKDKETIKKKYIYKERIQKNNKGRVMWVMTGTEFIPDIDAKVIVQDVFDQRKAIEIIGGWNNYTNSYWNELVEVYDKILATLNDLINNLNYFKMGVRF